MPSAGLRAAGFISYAPAAAAAVCMLFSYILFIYIPPFFLYFSFTVHDDACLSATPKRPIHHSFLFAELSIYTRGGAAAGANRLMVNFEQPISLYM